MKNQIRAPWPASVVVLVTCFGATDVAAAQTAGSITDMDRMNVVGERPPTDMETMQVKGVRPPTAQYITTGSMTDIGLASYPVKIPGWPYMPPPDQLGAYEDCTSQSGNPVVVTTGNKVEVETLFSTPEEMGLYLRLAWNGKLGRRGIAGLNFLTNFDKRLVFRFENGQECAMSPGSGACYQLYNSRLVQIFVQKPDGSAINVYTWGQSPNPNAMYSIVGNFSAGWTLRVDGEGQEKYSGGGLIVQETSPQGVQWNYEYDAGGSYLQRVTHSNGRAIQFSWSNGRLVAIQDPAGSIYQLNESATETTLTYPGAPTTQLTYHYQNVSIPFVLRVLTGKSYNGVRFSTFTYDSAGRVTSGVHAGGVDKHEYAYTVNSAGAITQTTETNPFGKEGAFTISGGNITQIDGHASTHCAATTSSKTYDARGNVASVTDKRGNVSNFNYNYYGQLLSETEGVGTPAQRQKTFVWDAAPRNRMLSEVRPALRERTYTYTANGRLASVTDKNLSANGVANQTRATTYAYTQYPNNLVQTMVQDGPVDRLTTTYTQKGEVESISNRLGHTTTYSNFNGLGQPGREVGANGEVKEYQYDARGRVTRVRQFPNGSTPADTTYSYAASGLLDSITRPDGVQQKYLYDHARRLMVEYEINGSGEYPYRRFTRDLASNVTVELVGLSASVPTL